MDLDSFDFDLPIDRIAQHPLADRSASRLLRLDRHVGSIEHRFVRELPAILRPGDLLVFNDTAVVPAKLALKRASGGRVVGLFLREVQGDTPGRVHWLTLLKSKGRLAPGERLTAESDATLAFSIRGKNEDGHWELVLDAPATGETTLAILARIGQTPLPPYIRRVGDQPEDQSRYQTVFASRPGAVAAPTAGLHFTRELLGELADRGIEQVRVTLHVGLGTFEPVRQSRVELHRMHSEWFECPAATADAVNLARADGRRVIAVGTTSVRVLESSVREDGRVDAGTGWTDIFIYPGYCFKVIDGLLTNFHLPRSTLLMLVAALAGREHIISAYRHAVEQSYRFFSYGDAMLIE